MQVYERGIDLYNYPVAFEIWNIYLSKFVSRYVSPLLLSLPIRAATNAIAFGTIREGQSWSELEIYSSRHWKSVLKSSASRFS